MIVTCAVQAQTPNPLILPYEWSYPLDIRSSCRIEYLATADVVALVRATVRTSPPLPRARWSRSAEELEPFDYRVDTFEVLDCPVGGLSGTVHVVVPRPSRGDLNEQERRNEAFEAASVTVGARYVLIARKPVDGRLLHDDLYVPPGPPPYADRWDRILMRSPDEVTGIALFPTKIDRMPEASDNQTLILKSLAMSFKGASDVDVRRLRLNLQHIVDEESRFELPEMYRQMMPILEDAVPTLSLYGRVNVLGILSSYGSYRNTINAAYAEQFLTALVEADAMGIRFNKRGDRLMPGFPPPKYFNHERLVEAAMMINDIFIKRQLLEKVGVKPSRDALLQMRGMLDEPALRFVVFDQFAKWAGREDLRPRLVFRQNERGFSERSIDREEFLLAYWRQHLP
ncbi:MAG: hypothetical protein D6724_08775 [Armatimonadetes bacterium]|nr:MAG: hypothetical protein D6724_08775 [Armatimonadota bacterium]